MVHLAGRKECQLNATSVYRSTWFINPRWAFPLAILLLVTAMLGPSAHAAERTRTQSKSISKTYATGWDVLIFAFTGLDNPCEQDNGGACARFTAPAKYPWLTDVRVSDAHGLPVVASVTLSDRSQTVPFICGELQRPVRIPPGAQVDVNIWWDPLELAAFYLVCGDTVPGTTGEIEVTFSSSKG